MFAKESPCPLCGSSSKSTSVPSKRDNRIDCPRCGLFDIDFRAEINLQNSFLPEEDLANLSGIARHSSEMSHPAGVPRLVWEEVEDDRNGQYVFQGIPSDRLGSKEKSLRFLDLLIRQKQSTPGETLQLDLPIDFSLVYARSTEELDSALDYLKRMNLIEIQDSAEFSRVVCLTVEGADFIESKLASEVERTTDSSLAIVDIKITGPKQDNGAFGEVYPGQQLKLGRKVAIKIIQPNDKLGAIEHAKGLAKVNHRNVVTVYDVGLVLDPSTGKNVECVVMEWIDGVNLHDAWCDLSHSDAYRICSQLIDGLEAMHQSDVCHHDLHAGNIMVSEDTIKIIDVHYTETAQFSNLTTQPKRRLIQNDCRALGSIVRHVILNACPHVLKSDLELELCKSVSLEEVKSIVSSTLGSVFDEPEADKGGDSDSAIMCEPILIEGHLLEDQISDRSYVVVTVQNVVEDNFPPYLLGLRNKRGVVYRGGFSCEKTGELLPTQKREHKFLLKGNTMTDGFLFDTAPEEITLVVQLEDSEKVLFESKTMGRSLTEAHQILERDGTIRIKDPVWWRMRSASEFSSHENTIGGSGKNKGNPNIRVRADLALANPPHRTPVPFAAIHIENHDSISVFIKSVALQMADQRQLFIMRDEITGNFFSARELKPGDSITWPVLLETIIQNAVQADKIVCAVANDAIGRRFAGDGNIQEVIRTLESLKASQKNAAIELNQQGKLEAAVANVNSSFSISVNRGEFTAPCKVEVTVESDCSIEDLAVFIVESDPVVEGLEFAAMRPNGGATETERVAIHPGIPQVFQFLSFPKSHRSVHLLTVVPGTRRSSGIQFLASEKFFVKQQFTLVASGKNAKSEPLLVTVTKNHDQILVE